MLGTFGFSYIGLIFLLCLFVPNILYAKNPPKDALIIKENRVLLFFERIGQVLCTALVLIFDDLNVKGISLWTIWLGAALVLMIMYIVCWIRYFRGEHISRDFLIPFLGIPLPLAVLPVTSVLLLAVYGKVIWIFIAGVILGIGHIGITAQHWNALKKAEEQ